MSYQLFIHLGDNMPVKEFPMRVEWNKRVGHHSAWISVGYTDKGPHFQCDYYGDMELGPIACSDFACDPPAWVIEALNLSK